MNKRGRKVITYSGLSRQATHVRKKVGGTARRFRTGGGLDNPIVQVNLQTNPGEFIFENSGKPYDGVYHLHKDGTFMIGAGKMGKTHLIKNDEIIVRKNQTENIVSSCDSFESKIDCIDSGCHWNFSENICK